MNKSNLARRLAGTAVSGLLALVSSAASGALQAGDKATAAAAPASLANELIGTWVLVGTPGHVGKAPSSGARFKFITANHFWCDTQADPKTGVVLFHHGGTYTLEGSHYYQSLEFANPTTMNLIGSTNGHFTIHIEGDLLTLLGTDNPWREVWKRNRGKSDKVAASSSLARGLQGTWVLADTEDKEANLQSAGRRLKFITATDWCDTQADLKTGVVIFHHGGPCRVKGSDYFQTVKYANPSSMALIGETFKFTARVEGDTLHLTGIGNPWTETWTRAK